MPEPVVLSWSGGKDSALALHELRRSPDHEVVGLLTTVTAEYGRISMHGVRRELLDRQARSAGLPVTVVEIPAGGSNEEYAARMGAALEEMRGRGVMTIAFGDLCLEDIRRYREEMLGGVGMRALFPLWGRDTAELAREFVSLGFRAVTSCVDSQALDRSFVGRLYDPAFLDELPPEADPCGENGEFHTFVFDGPVFAEPVEARPGEIVLRDGRFWFCDLLPAA